ncbi:hypothetical protein WJ45_16795 [Burkholderia ubonensis]|nr:hypothetical protein WJ45_16795 [Burkholderia ubonensis]KVQ49266.1 hypothetical protein WK04_07665 [Burkholderia ubonensis]
MTSAGKWPHAKTEYSGAAMLDGLLRCAARSAAAVFWPPLCMLVGVRLRFADVYDVRAVAGEPGLHLVILTRAIVRTLALV